MKVFSSRCRRPRLGVPVPAPRRTSVHLIQRFTLRVILLSLRYRRSHAGRTWMFARGLLLSGQCWFGYRSWFGTLYPHRSLTVWFTVSSRRLGAGLSAPFSSRMGPLAIDPYSGTLVLGTDMGFKISLRVHIVFLRTPVWHLPLAWSMVHALPGRWLVLCSSILCMVTSGHYLTVPVDASTNQRFRHDIISGNTA